MLSLLLYFSSRDQGEKPPHYSLFFMEPRPGLCISSPLSVIWRRWLFDLSGLLQVLLLWPPDAQTSQDIHANATDLPNSHLESRSANATQSSRMNNEYQMKVRPTSHANAIKFLKSLPPYKSQQYKLSPIINSVCCFHSKPRSRIRLYFFPFPGSVTGKGDGVWGSGGIQGPLAAVPWAACQYNQTRDLTPPITDYFIPTSFLFSLQYLRVKSTHETITASAFTPQNSDTQTNFQFII